MKNYCLTALLIAGLSSCTFLKIVYYNFSSIDDYKIFPNRDLKASKSPFHFKENLHESIVPEKISFGKKRNISLKNLLESTNTVAFLIIKNDTLLYEKYFDDYNDSTLSMSFSMAKAVLSALIGCAMNDGYLESIEQPVTDLVPELEKNGFGKVQIKHLLQMTSGMDYVENDNPFGIHPRFYYTSNIEKEILKVKLNEDPGTEFIYKSGDNILLGLILTRALKTKNITEYLQEKIWEPIGMEFDGYWSIDNNQDGMEKTWCCISARARDYAKFGRLYLHYGNWEGRQIIPRDWIEQSTKIDTTDGSARFYQYGWWIMSEKYKDYRAEGHLGQFIYINPVKHVIIVRLGRNLGGIKWKNWKEIFTFLAEEI